MKPAKILTESEEENIIDNIVRCINLRDIRYLKPPSFVWLKSCNGFHSDLNWDGFTEQYSNVDIFLELFIKYQVQNQNDAIEGTRNWEWFQQRASMYNSIINSYKK